MLHPRGSVYPYPSRFISLSIHSRIRIIHIYMNPAYPFLNIHCPHIPRLSITSQAPLFSHSMASPIHRLTGKAYPHPHGPNLSTSSWSLPIHILGDGSPHTSALPIHTALQPACPHTLSPTIYTPLIPAYPHTLSPKYLQIPGPQLSTHL